MLQKKREMLIKWTIVPLKKLDLSIVAFYEEKFALCSLVETFSGTYVAEQGRPKIRPKIRPKN